MAVSWLRAGPANTPKLSQRVAKYATTSAYNGDSHANGGLERVPKALRLGLACARPCDIPHHAGIHD